MGKDQEDGGQSRDGDRSLERSPYSSPRVILPSYLGHLLYTTPDLHDFTRTDLLISLDISDVHLKDFGPASLDDLSVTPKNVQRVMTYRGVLGPPIACDATKGLSILTRGGRKNLTLDQYLDRAVIDRPNYLVALADEVGQAAGHNRRRKAIERTKVYLKGLLRRLRSDQDSPLNNTSILGVVLNDIAFPAHLAESVDQMLQTEELTGLVVGGLYMGESPTEREEIIRAVVNRVEAASATALATATSDPAAAPVGAKKHLVMVQGVDSIADILQCVRVGVDWVYSCYPAVLTRKGHALDLDLSHISPTTLQASTNRKRLSEESSVKDTEPESKRQKLERDTVLEGFAPSFNTLPDEDEQPAEEETAPPSSSLALAVDAYPQADFLPDEVSISLWQTKYARDPAPLQDNCSCHACRHYSKAYIHHLLRSKELLAEVLLYQHNQHQLLELFKGFREAASLGLDHLRLYILKLEEIHQIHSTTRQ